MLRREPLIVQAGPIPQRTFGLSFTGEKLPDVLLQAHQEKLYPRYADFHRRSQQGAGFYITWKEIKAKRYNRASDAARSVRGVQVRCPTSDCVIEMTRSACLPRGLGGRPPERLLRCQHPDRRRLRDRAVPRCRGDAGGVHRQRHVRSDHHLDQEQAVSIAG